MATVDLSICDADTPQQQPGAPDAYALVPCGAAAPSKGEVDVDGWAIVPSFDGLHDADGGVCASLGRPVCQTPAEGRPKRPRAVVALVGLSPPVNKQSGAKCDLLDDEMLNEVLYNARALPHEHQGVSKRAKHHAALAGKSGKRGCASMVPTAAEGSSTPAARQAGGEKTARNRTTPQKLPPGGPVTPSKAHGAAPLPSHPWTCLKFMWHTFYVLCRTRRCPSAPSPL